MRLLGLIILFTLAVGINAQARLAPSYGAPNIAGSDAEILEHLNRINQTELLVEVVADENFYAEEIVEQLQMFEAFINGDDSINLEDLTTLACSPEQGGCCGGNQCHRPNQPDVSLDEI